MQLTSENGNFQTWNHKNVIIRVNTKGDIVIIQNDEGEQTLLKRVPYTKASFQMIKDFYEGNLSGQYSKATDANYINPEAAGLLENWASCDIEMIDEETALMSEGETFSLYRPKIGNGMQVFRNKAWPLSDRTRWIIEPSGSDFILRKHSTMDIVDYMASVDGPALHVYTPTRASV